ncbi:MAG: family 1 glycosylhydrolase [Bacteroidota bacterium]
MITNSTKLDIWAGIECTYNRVNDNYQDQLEKAGFYTRQNDLERIAGLGIKMIRFPVIWEKHEPVQQQLIDWHFTEESLSKLQELKVEPIVGLVHHGSGPAFASFFNGSFEEGLASYAAKVAAKFNWVNYYTPVNEPLTTARFCGLYGHWYPHEKSEETFLQILLSECRATVLAMQEIRKINPAAKLVQTEDLGKTHSTPFLQQQADHENRRRWLSFDLLCGHVDEAHALYPYLLSNGVTTEQLLFFKKYPCPPDIIGINHYITSERYLDENRSLYPAHTWGGNGYQQYADVEAVRVSNPVLSGPYILLKEAWDRYGLPLAVTEVHLHCTREEQLRWFGQVYQDSLRLKEEGADIKAITAWAVLGSFDWCSLLTRCEGSYEPGLFDVRPSEPRATALTKIVSALANGKNFDHPLMQENGWWKRSCRIIYEVPGFPVAPQSIISTTKPLLITGKTGTLGTAFARLCDLRGIHYILLGRDDVNLADERSIEKLILDHKPWALVNTAGFVRVDDAEMDRDNCFLANTTVPSKLAAVCKRYDVKFVTFSSDLVFNGHKKDPYLESDIVSPLNIYGQSKALAEQLVMNNNPAALIVRTSAFFGPWDKCNFIFNALNAFKNHQQIKVAADVTVSPTYVPDLVNNTLDLLIDDENGIWNLSNKGEVTWAMLATEVAERTGYNKRAFEAVSISDLGLMAQRPAYSVLTTEKGFEMPSLENALNRYFHQQEQLVL